MSVFVKAAPQTGTTGTVKFSFKHSQFAAEKSIVARDKVF
jgi:hypothetical protein